MLKRFFKGLLCVAIACATFGAVGCGGEKEADSYTIQYTDGTNTHTLKVGYGDTYSFENIPERYGYEFLGWYDMETGGTKYVNANGMCFSPFMTDGNVILYPQFKAKEYTLIFDYQGATVSGVRSMTVAYDSTLYGLPTNLMLANQTFLGWYTEPDEQGTQIADQYGVLPALKVNENLFDLSNQDGKIYLYAGFKGVEYSVALHFSANLTEEILVEHGTNIKDILYETRLDGQGVVAWSTEPNDQDKSHVVSGKITSGMELYPAEYAPMIDFDENGGKELPPLVARVGEAITLPTPEKANYRFVEWQDQSGTARKFTIMPETGLTLKAVYAPIILFDSNGGTQAQEISELVGTDITLPTPEREGFIFAGWYTEGGEKYTATKMPTVSVKLKAGWYEVRTETVVVVTGDKSYYYYDSLPTLQNKELPIDCSSFLADDFSGTVQISVHFKAKAYDASSAVPDTLWLYLYKAAKVSDSNLLSSGKFSIPHEDPYKQYSWVDTIYMEGNKLYCATQTKDGDGYGAESRRKIYITDFYINFTYPDLTKLYL